jgi:hypothetical protein
MGKDALADVTTAGRANTEMADNCIYQGSLITRDNNCSLEVKRRIGIAAGM